jgi:hypothetical protein
VFLGLGLEDGADAQHHRGGDPTEHAAAGLDHGRHGPTGRDGAVINCRFRNRETD